MERVGLTNFALWGLAALVVGIPLSLFGVPALVTGIGALAVAWWTRFWPEGLGVAAGSSVAVALMATWAVTERAGGALDFIAAGLLFGATWVMWRVRLRAYIAVHAGNTEPAPAVAPDAASKPWRLAIGASVFALALVPLQIILYIWFWFGRCGTDTSPAPPDGSAVARHCDYLGENALLLVVGPTLVAIVLGVVLASLRRPRLLLVSPIAGIALTIALHLPDWTLG